MGTMAAALLVIAVAGAPFALMAPDAGPAADSSLHTRAPPCPPGHRALPERAERMWRLLEGTLRDPELRHAIAARPRVCFRSAAESAITAGGLMVLDPRVDDAENAARLGHLLLHRSQSSLRIAASARGWACADVVEAAIAAEAQAHALELELRRALGVTDPKRVFPFERAFWQTPAPEREAMLRAYFFAHPDGAPGVPGFVRAYRSRCAELETGTDAGASVDAPP